MNETTPDIPVPTILGFPLNRVIAFAGPQIAAAAGFIATWIISALHVTAIPHDSLAAGVANVVVFVLTTGLTWLGQRAWLKGYHIQLEALTPNVVKTIEPAHVFTYTSPASPPVSGSAMYLDPNPSPSETPATDPLDLATGEEVGDVPDPPDVSP